MSTLNRFKEFLSYLVRFLAKKIKRNRIALVVGHNKKKKGAKAFNGVYEYEYNSDVAEKVKALCKNYDVEVFYQDDLTDYQLAKKVFKFNPEIAIELHFNASGILQANGCEALVIQGCSRSAFYAASFCELLSKNFEIKRRHGNGVKYLAHYNRGFKNLYRFKQVASFPVFIIEPEFLDFKSNASERFFSNKDDYVKVFNEFFKIHF